MQIQVKKKINYNDAIKFLISNLNNKKNQEKFRKACEKIKDIDIDDVLDELYLERRKDEFSF